MGIKYNEITVVYFESSSHAEEVATFVDDETYGACMSALEDYAAKGGMVVTESVVEMPDRNIGIGILEREEFISKAFEIAFGDDAINKNFSFAEVLRKLRDFSDDLLLEYDRLNEDFGDEDDDFVEAEESDEEVEFEVEFISSTYRSYKVSARDSESAEQKAWEELNIDCDVSRAWRENAELKLVKK